MLNVNVNWKTQMSKETDYTMHNIRTTRVCVPPPSSPIVVPFILYKGDNKYNSLGRVRNFHWPSQFWLIESISIYQLFTKPHGVYVISKLLKITAQSPLYKT